MHQNPARCPFAAQRDSRSGSHPLHLRRSVLNREILRPVLRALGLGAFPEDPHVVLAQSARPVDWALPVFEPDPHRIAITPRNPRYARPAEDDRVALVFDAPDLERRWQELVAAGASWDLPGFTPSIDLGRVPGALPHVCFFAGPILLGPEWRATPGCASAAGRPVLG
jgi:hypothetical protein